LDFQNRLSHSALIRYGAFLLAGALLLGGCAFVGSSGGQRLPSVPAAFVTDSGTTEVTVEIARRSEERQIGLMDRTEMPENHGMLFVYDSPRPPHSGFWMHRTLIPLDIAYMDENNVILNIQQMKPCPSFLAIRCPTYYADVSYTNVVEMNEGFFRAHNISVGDRLEVAEQ